MAAKRKSTTNFSVSQASPKRYRPSPPLLPGDDDDTDPTSPKHTSSSKIDPDYGQRGAFPGLDDIDGEDHLFYGPASDGLEYLRMVRSEATTVPRLLVAPEQEHGRVKLEDGEEYEQGGRYADGAYIAEALDEIPDGPRGEKENESDVDPQGACYTALVDRFLDLRYTLFISPPPERYVSIDVLRHHAKRGRWDYGLRHTTPKAVDLAPATQEDIIRGISRLQSSLSKKNMLDEVVGENLGAWAWALLGKCRNLGNMNSDDVSVIRNLGKTALVVCQKVRRGFVEKWVKEEEDEESEEGADDTNGADTADVRLEPQDEGARRESTNNLKTGGTQQENGDAMDTDEAEMERLKKGLLGRLDEELGENNPQATKTNIEQHGKGDLDGQTQRVLAAMDIIITIIGEVFGQRDLLDRREAWELPL